MKHKLVFCVNVPHNLRKDKPVSFT